MFFFVWCYFPRRHSILFYDLSRDPLRNHKECIDINRAVDGNRLTHTIRTSASCDAGPSEIRGRGCKLSYLFIGIRPVEASLNLFLK